MTNHDFNIRYRIPSLNWIRGQTFSEEHKFISEEWISVYWSLLRIIVLFLHLWAVKYWIRRSRGIDRLNLHQPNASATSVWLRSRTVTLPIKSTSGVFLHRSPQLYSSRPKNRPQTSCSLISAFRQSTCCKQDILLYISTLATPNRFTAEMYFYKLDHVSHWKKPKTIENQFLFTMVTWSRGSSKLSNAKRSFIVNCRLSLP